MCEIDPTTRVKNLDEAVCISYSANTIGKGMNRTLSLLRILVNSGADRTVVALDVESGLGEGKKNPLNLNQLWP